MGDSDKSIHRREEPSPYEKIVVNPIEQDRKQRENYSSLKNSTHSQIFATLASYFKKMLSSISPKGRGRSVLVDEQSLFDNILAFRQTLLTLSKQDESHNPDFTQKLTELWHNLLDDCNSLSYTLKTSSELLTKVNFFLSQVQNFPAGADHTLGYYFAEYAGREWIPFPFMELLQGLHEDFQAHTTNSTLANWIALLNDIIGRTTESSP